MRWPFGPPHLTLKPSQNKTKKPKNTKKTRQQHPTTKPITKQTKQKQKQHKKEKQTQETQKHLNLPNPDEQQRATPEKPPKLGKTSIFNTIETIPDTPKTNLLILKPKKQTQKTPFCHVQKQPTVFHKFSVFSTYNFCFWKAVFAENTIKIVFSGKHSFSKTQLVKPTFFNHVKKHLFQKKGVIFVFLQFPLKPLLL